LLENNAPKLTNAQWDTVVMAFLRLFKGTTPHQLFDESLRAEGEVVPVAGDRGTFGLGQHCSMLTVFVRA
jgi:hypothetical protein